MIDFQKVLKYHFCPVPLSICNADGTHRTTIKSKPNQIIFSGIEGTSVLGSSSDQRKNILLVDTMALMNTIIKVRTTYFALAKKLHQYHTKILQTSWYYC